ncbi:hypothetical protein [Pontibacter harenae]|uniref:hypothetical protein n=1 Tax=Pontibacter harenae TaxID=2894083 RepID=UPI001E538028|nr:hypothetical protein [Pontibacter harenae]MCC9168060.1 hypothetical protein [Pontibacter harenae]
MKYVDLGTGFLLTGFPDFESAFAASEEWCGKGFKVAYLNEATHVNECEIVTYLKSIEAADTRLYQNYHYKNGEYAKEEVADSLQTALEVLEKKLNAKAKFIMVLAPKHVNVVSRQAVWL